MELVFSSTQGYLKHTRNTQENFIHNNHYCYKISNLKSEDLINSFSDLKKNINFVFIVN